MGFENSDKDRKKKQSILIVVDDEFCTKDKVCPAVAACPVGALSQEGFNPPKVDGVLCTRCCICVDICETGALDIEELLFDVSFD